MEPKSNFGWNEAIQKLYADPFFDEFINHEPINELNNMIKHSKATNQQQAEVGIKEKDYIVGSVDTYGNFSFAANPVLHGNRDSAGTEAKRLALASPGKTFVVAQLIVGYRANGLMEF